MPRFLDLRLFISNDIVSVKVYDIRNDFDFKIVNFLFLVLVVCIFLDTMGAPLEECQISKKNWIKVLI